MAKTSKRPHGGPLSGVRVLEFSLVFSAPYAGVQLSDLGAEVIKVEPPGGEPFRNLGTPVPGYGKNFQWANRGKQSLVIDLKRPEGRGVVHRLLEKIDVVLINYRPGVAKQLGLDYEALSAIKPDLIYAEINGFGSEGPLAELPASDIVAQAYGGAVALDAKLDESGAPVGPALPVGDLPSGIAAAMGISAALYHRERTGEGQCLSVSLLRTVMQMGFTHVMVEPVNDEVLRDFIVREIERRRADGGSYADLVTIRSELGIRGSPMSLYFSGYLAKDGGLVLGALTPANRDAFRSVLGIDDDLSDQPGFDGSDPANQERIEVLRGRIRVILMEKTVEEWTQLFIEAGAPGAPVILPEDLLRHPQTALHFMELQSEITGPQQQVRPLVELSGSPDPARTAAPIIGAHSQRVLVELAGYGESEINALREAGVIE
ncbi:MAG: CoA transferase [Deltaproteobacteria bacterium]|nr:CoA transferase [Deltaproteobacteria bacterium]